MKILKDDSMGAKLLSNTMVFAVGNFATKLMYFILLPLYTQTLTAEQYGIIDAISATVDFLLPLLTLCIYEAILRFTLDNYHSEEIFAMAMRIALLALMAVGITSPFFLKILKIEKYAFFFFITFATGTLKNILYYYARGKNRVLLSVGCGLANVLLLTIFNLVILLGMKKGIEGYYISAIISDIAVITLLLLELKIKIQCLLRKCENRVKKEALRYTLPMVANQMCWWVNYTLDKYILIYFHGLDISGIYAVAYKVPGILNTIMGVFLQAWQLSAVEEYSKGREKTFDRLYKIYFNAASFVCLLLIISCNFAAHILFAKEFYIGWHYVPILLIALFFHTNAAFLGTVFTTTKHTNILFYSTLLGAVVNMVFNFLLIPKYSAYGASVATLFSYALIWFVRYWKAKKEIQFHTSVSMQSLPVSILVLAALIKLFISNFYIQAIFYTLFMGAIILFNYKTIVQLALFLKNLIIKFNLGK